eukprot:13330859-Alexandrium_andersonii.AAC.1
MQFGDMNHALREFGVPPEMSGDIECTFWGTKPIAGLSPDVANLGVDHAAAALLSIVSGGKVVQKAQDIATTCLLYTSPSPRD